MEKVIADFVHQKECAQKLDERRLVLVAERNALDVQLSNISGYCLGTTLLHLHRRSQALKDMEDARNLWDTLPRLIIARFCELRGWNDSWKWLHQNVEHIFEETTWAYFTQMWGMEGPVELATQVSVVGPPHTDMKFVRLQGLLQELNVPETSGLFQKNKLILSHEQFAKVRATLETLYSAAASELGGEFFSVLRKVVPYVNDDRLCKQRDALTKQIEELDQELGQAKLTIERLKNEIGV